MDRLKTTVFSAFVLAFLLAPAASAQATAAKLEIVSGNGQMICPNCSFKKFTYFFPMVVKVTDISGNPIAGKTVNWSLQSTIGIVPVFDTSTVTNSSGIAIAQLFQANGAVGSPQLPFLQSVISANVDGLGINFTETQALADNFSQQIVFTRLDAPTGGAVLTGPAGSKGTEPIRVHVDGRGVPVPNVSIRILNEDPKTLPGASCATAPGADPGSVLTDQNGDGVCYPVFGPIAGKGPVSVLVGGLDPAQFDQSMSPQPLAEPLAFFQYNGIQVNATAVTPGRVSIVNGNNQNLNPGQSSQALVVKVTDASGAVPIANTSVQWTVTPIGAATLSSSLTNTDTSGQAQTTVILSPTAVGQVTVKAALTGANSAISNTFTVLTIVQISSVTKVSGDVQTAPAGQLFPNPLVVQVMGTNGSPVVNQPVTFTVTGGSATLSGSTSNTDGNGRAQVTVKAVTPGAVTVAATVGSITQTFSLTVIPPGPALTSNSFYTVGGFSKIGALAPCSLVTVIAAGLAPNLQGLVLNTNSFGPWSGTVAGDTVTVNNLGSPIFSVGQANGSEQITFQVPCDVAPASSVPVTISVGGGAATVNMPVQLANPGILETLMSDNSRRAVVVRPDGSWVSLQNPARRGEVVRVFVTGLGAAIPAVGSGSLPVPGSDSLISGQVIVGVNNAGARVVTSRLAPNLIGVAEVAFQVPNDAPTNNDVVLSVAVNAVTDSQTRFSNGSKLPIQ
ncbi:MAG: Ig-like domain-containing protein [Candidatus Solibacter sp.]